MNPEFAAQVIRDPAGIISETMMPKVDMPDTTLNLLINYLVQQDLPRVESSYLSHIDNPPYFFQDFVFTQSFGNFCAHIGVLYVLRTVQRVKLARVLTKALPKCRQGLANPAGNHR